MATTTRSTTRRRLYRFTIAQVEEMLRSGLLCSRDRAMLLEGVLYRKMGRNPGHIVTASRLDKSLHRQVPDGYTICNEATIEVPWPGRPRRGSLPEPDSIVIVGDPDLYNRRIVPAEIAVVIKIADTSLRDDRGETKERYARAAIPVYWLINLPGRRIEVYTDPTGFAPTPDYRRMTSYGVDQDVPLVLGGVGVGRTPVRDPLPSPRPRVHFRLRAVRHRR